jgi:hypothetical protein
MKINCPQQEINRICPLGVLSETVLLIFPSHDRVLFADTFTPPPNLAKPPLMVLIMPHPPE